MKIPAKIEYAYKAILELAKAHETKKPVRVNTIADAQEISGKFLLQVMIQLKNAGLVKSVRGAAGGYLLSSSPKEISLQEVIEAVDTNLFEPAFSTSRVLSASEKPLAGLWGKVNADLRGKFSKVCFDQLLLEAQSKESFIYKI